MRLVPTLTPTRQKHTKTTTHTNTPQNHHGVTPRTKLSSCDGFWGIDENGHNGKARKNMMVQLTEHSGPTTDILEAIIRERKKLQNRKHKISDVSQQVRVVLHVLRTNKQFPTAAQVVEFHPVATRYHGVLGGGPSRRASAQPRALTFGHCLQSHRRLSLPFVSFFPCTTKKGDRMLGTRSLFGKRSSTSWANGPMESRVSSF